MIGQVTAVITSICRVAWAAAPTTRTADGPIRPGPPVLLCHQLVAELDHVAILRCALVPWSKRPRAVGFRVAAVWPFALPGQGRQSLARWAMLQKATSFG